METQPNITEINTPDALWDQIRVSTEKHVPEIKVARSGRYDNLRNIQLVVGTVLKQLFDGVHRQVCNEIEIPAEDESLMSGVDPDMEEEGWSRIYEERRVASGIVEKEKDAERRRIIALLAIFRQKMEDIIAGETPEELSEIKNLKESPPLQSIDWLIEGTRKNIGHFVSLIMKDVFPE